jgi:hypothetical protein
MLERIFIKLIDYRHVRGITSKTRWYHFLSLIKTSFAFKYSFASLPLCLFFPFIIIIPLTEQGGFDWDSGGTRSFWWVWFGIGAFTGGLDPPPWLPQCLQPVWKKYVWFGLGRWFDFAFHAAALLFVCAMVAVRFVNFLATRPPNLLFFSLDDQVGVDPPVVRVMAVIPFCLFVVARVVA